MNHLRFRCLLVFGATGSSSEIAVVKGRAMKLRGNLGDVLVQEDPSLPRGTAQALGAPDAEIQPVVSNEVLANAHRVHPRPRCPNLKTNVTKRV